MKNPRVRQQAGYALILIVLGLMGVGGVVIAGFTQQAKQDVEQQRYLRNQRVLQEAKQALLMYAYNYPQTVPGRGPGRLPCPDTDTNGLGTPNPSADCEDGLGNGVVGRFPWGAVGMQFYDVQDASGESLWYAVSKEFANFTAGNSINSDSLGSITIYDQSGATIYDGDPLVATGVAAVIIAPGPPIALDENDDGNYEYAQVRGTPIQRADPRNYLDTFNDFVNNTFINDENDSNDDGFILGPVKEDDPNSPAFNTAVVNDQIIVITTEELIEVAERSVFQTYRSALNQYQANIGIARYPWLDPYDSDDDLVTFNAVATPANPVVGRLPSIFADYFVPGPSQAIRPVLRLSITIEDEVHNMTIPMPAGQDVSFDVAGNLISAIPDGLIVNRFFWDGTATGVAPNHMDNVWEMCPTVTFDEEDCNRDAAGNYMGTTASDIELRTRQIDITFDGGGAPIVFAFTDLTLSPIEYWSGGPENPDPGNHVYIAAEYDDTPPTNYISQFDYVQDDQFQNSHSEYPVGANSGSLTYGNGVADSIKVGLPYYPVLPDWVLVNNWHDMMQVAYSVSMRPGGDGDCVLPANDCLTLQYPGAVTKERLGLLILSGSEGDFNPDNTAFIDDTNPGNPHLLS